MTDWLGNASTFSYDANGNLTRTVFPSGVTTTSTYDNGDALSASITVDTHGTTLLGLAYTRDAAGRIGSETDTVGAASTSQAFSYDRDGRLALVSPTAAAQLPANVLTYDGADQLTADGPASATRTYAYDAAGELSGVTLGVTGAVSHSYANGPRGERLRDTDSLGNQRNYSWDGAGHLAGYQGPVLTQASAQAGTTIDVSYAFDGLGLRASRTVAGQATQLLAYATVDGGPRLISDGPLAAYVDGPGGLPLEQVTLAGVLYYHHDAQGSTRLLTDSAQRPRANYTYDAYGAVTPSAGAVVNPFLFQGQYTDYESGLQCLTGRCYDPATRQYLSRTQQTTAEQRPYVGAADDPINAPAFGAGATQRPEVGPALGGDPIPNALSLGVSSPTTVSASVMPGAGGRRA